MKKNILILVLVSACLLNGCIEQDLYRVREDTVNGSHEEISTTTTSITNITSTTIRIAPPTLSRGIVLTKKDSNVEKIAGEVAIDKNWSFLAVSSKDPEEIKKEIVDVVNKKDAGYLLIIGTDEEIPLIDRLDLIKLYDTHEAGLAVLDSLFYGDVDDDGFVELGVGRLPFNNETIIRGYFEDLNVYGEKQYFFYYPIYDDVDIFSKGEGACLIKEFNNSVMKIKAEKEEVIRSLKDARLFTISTHGATWAWTLSGTYFSIDDIPNIHNNRPIIISDACNTAKELGPEFIKHGASAFLGQYTTTGSYYTDRTLILSKKILNGRSMGDSIKDYLNYAMISCGIDSYIGKMWRVNNTTHFQQSCYANQEPLEYPILNIQHNSSERGDYTIILLGDPSVNIEKIYSNLQPPSVERGVDSVSINIPAVTEKVSFPNSSRSFDCFGGENHIALHTANTGGFIFELRKIEQINNGKMVVENNEHNLSDIKGMCRPIILIRGNTERFISMKGDSRMRSALFSKNRTLILDFQ